MVGKYCKAYLVSQLRHFARWTEQVDNLRRENRETDGQGVEDEWTLADDDYLYLQENYIVTDGVFKDEHVIFDDITPEWIAFCQQELGFKVPTWARGELAENTAPEI